MNNFLEKLKDFLYDATDYIIMLVVVLVVAGIIGWRLEILFAEDTLEEQTEKDKIVASDKIEEDKKIEKDDEVTEDKETINEDEDKQDKKDTEDKDEKVENKDKKAKDKSDKKDEKKDENKDKNSDKVITISIPEGSLSGAIADILLEEKLIADKDDFLKTAKDLNLETKLKPGKFEIKSNSTYEEILKILSK